jgi:hypothetical protein
LILLLLKVSLREREMTLLRLFAIGFEVHGQDTHDCFEVLRFLAIGFEVP